MTRSLAFIWFLCVLPMYFGLVSGENTGIFSDIPFSKDMKPKIPKLPSTLPTTTSTSTIPTTTEILEITTLPWTTTSPASTTTTSPTSTTSITTISTSTTEKVEIDPKKCKDACQMDDDCPPKLKCCKMDELSCKVCNEPSQCSSESPATTTTTSPTSSTTISTSTTEKVEIDPKKCKDACQMDDDCPPKLKCCKMDELSCKVCNEPSHCSSESPDIAKNKTSKTIDLNSTRNVSSHSSLLNIDLSAHWIIGGSALLGAVICLGSICLIVWKCKKVRAKRKAQQALVYSYVSVEIVPHSQAQALAAANKRLGEKNFVPRVPLRPHEYPYDYVRPNLPLREQDSDYDYVTSSMVPRPKNFI